MKNKLQYNNDIKFCVVIPTYNNHKSLKSVIENVSKHCSSIIIIDDGSTDSTKTILGEFHQYEIITHQINKGKGRALRNAFQRAIELGYDYAISIDSDGQHDPDDIPKMIQRVLDNHGALVMGSRNMSQDGIPRKSSFGNQFSSFWFWAETGIRLSDTQTGFRAYPLKSIEGKKWYTDRFEFEIEVIVRLAWDNVKFLEQPVNVEYMEDRVSHFRPAQDFSRISVMHTVMTTLGWLFFLPRLILWNFSIKSLFYQVKGEFVNNSGNPTKLAGSVGLGLFFGVFPVWGFQMAIAFAVASIFRLNRIIVLFSSNISIPPILPFIIYFSFQFGALFVTKQVKPLDIHQLTLSSIHLHAVQYLIGASLLAIALGALGFIITWGIAKLFSLKKK